MPIRSSPACIYLFPRWVSKGAYTDAALQSARLKEDNVVNRVVA